MLLALGPILNGLWTRDFRTLMRLRSEGRYSVFWMSWSFIAKKQCPTANFAILGNEKKFRGKMKSLPVLPSDHFGLVVTLKPKKGNLAA